MADRYRTCPQCGEQFGFGPGRGLARKYCGDICATASHRSRFKARMGVCPVEGCEHKSRSASTGYCEMHYWRVRRNGSLDALQPKDVLPHSHGYLLLYAPDHPLRKGKAGSREYQHRVVFYDEYGEGPFRCHWCDMVVTWSDMDVDHVNAKRDDNDINNLVPSCHSCNIKRGIPAMTASVRASRATMLTVNGVTKTVVEWANAIGITRVSLKARLRAGWSPERAVSEHRGVTGPRGKAMRSAK